MVMACFHFGAAVTQLTDAYMRHDAENLCEWLWWHNGCTRLPILYALAEVGTEIQFLA